MSHTIKPEKEGLNKARKIADRSLSDAENKLAMEQESIIDLRWTNNQHVIEKMDGVSGYFEYPNILVIEFNTTPEKWKESLEDTVYHEHAHAWDCEQRGQKWKKEWQYVLGEALAQHFAEKNAEYDAPWRTKFNKKEVAEHWKTIRKEELERDKNYYNSSGTDPLFINQEKGGYPNWLGYSLSYQIGKKLLGGHNLKEFPTVEKEEVIEAGNQLYRG